jgi:hypothetical protein
MSETLNAARSILLSRIQIVNGLAHVTTDGLPESCKVAKFKLVQYLLVLPHQNIHSRLANPEVLNAYSGFGSQGVVNPRDAG